MKKYQSLHAHTTNSDGQHTPIELLNLAMKYNVDALAYTDHDSILSQKQIKEIQNFTDVRWISGIEISSGWPLDLGGGISSLFHIVGLFVDYNNKNLLDYCKLAQQARIERMDKMVKNLKELGFNITQEDCLKQSGGESVARPHIVKALLSKEENISIINKIKKDMEQAAKIDPEINTKYSKLNEIPFEKYPYTLFLSNDSFINNVYVDYLYYLDFDQTVKLIRQAGGVAILAHYSSVSEKISPDILEEYIISKRLDGIETVFGLEAFGTPQQETMLLTMGITKNIVNKLHCIESGGADIHTTKQFEDMLKYTDYGKLTSNLLENMLRNFKLNTEFSSIY